MTSLATATLALLLPAQFPLAPEPPSTTGTSGLTTGGLFWSFPTVFRAQIALGDRGGQVLALTAEHELVLLSSFDASPPTSAWGWQPAGDWTGIHPAADADVYLHADVRTDNLNLVSIGTLKKYRSGSPLPEWRFTFPEQFWSRPAFDVSRDGETVVSAFADEATSRLVLRVHDPATGSPVRTIVHPALVYAVELFDLSPDGTVAAFCDEGFTGDLSEVYDLETGRHLFTAPGNFPGRQALSDGGRVFATVDRSDSTTEHVRAFRRVPGGYELAFDVPTPGGIDVWDLAVSDDGSTVVAAWFDTGTPKRSIVRAYDVATGAMTMEHVDVSTGNIIPGDVAISADGARFVVSLWGTGAGSAPELAVYSRDSNQPIREHPNQGSVYEVEISPDGKRYAASRTPGNRGYTTGMIELYELGGEDFVVRGRPSVGETITFELHGAPGSRAALLRSLARAPNPIDVPGVGTLHLDPASLSSTSMGVVPPSGVATYATNADTIPSMLGRTLWFQGLTSSPRHLTNDFVQLTILP